jgi:hypothetical protein
MRCLRRRFKYKCVGFLLSTTAELVMIARGIGFSPATLSAYPFVLVILLHIGPIVVPHLMKAVKTGSMVHAVERGR